MLALRMAKRHCIVYSIHGKIKRKKRVWTPVLGQFFRRVVSINTIKGKNEPTSIYPEHFFSFIRINL